MGCVLGQHDKTGRGEQDMPMASIRDSAFLSYSIDLLCYDEMNLRLPHSLHEIPLILCHFKP